MKVCMAYDELTMNVTSAMDEVSKIHSNNGLYTRQENTWDVVVCVWKDKHTCKP